VERDRNYDGRQFRVEALNKMAEELDEKEE